MKSEIESITPILDTRPDVKTEREDRAVAKSLLKAYLVAHPGVDLEQSELKKIAKCDAVTQRIRELVRDDNLNIESVPTFLTDAAGRKHRLLNRYRFTPYAPLGRDGADVIDQKSPL